MTKATDILSRARAQKQAAMRQTAPPVVQAQPNAQVTVHPPEIPPMVPMPKPRVTIYKELMHKHDRMGTRHLTT